MASHYSDKKARRMGDDRLSALPDSIIHHIFSLMDIESCIRMSLLSKNLKWLWNSLPDLNFDGWRVPNKSKAIRFRNLVLRALYDRDHHVPINSLRLVFDIQYDIEDGHGDFSRKFADYLESPETCIRHLSIVFTLGCVVPSYRMPTLTTLYLEGCDFSRNPNCLDPFASCVNLEQLFLHNCGFSEGFTWKITGPQLLRLEITDLACNGFYDIYKFEIWTPKLLSLRLNLFKPLDFSTLHLPSLKNLDLQIFHATTSNRKTISLLINMFRGFHHAQYVKLCSKIILILSLLHGLAALHKQPPPFTRLKTLTIQRREGDSLNKIPDDVLSYFLKGNSIASVEYE
ncbi:hypothetical protein CCACVL1_01503 [Corchorus capsularis]|uniref:F-box domain-containing protein n=1 Tax=Corchorus capsularis TaxID=210143 RepID=A0A1R3KHQ3_COCAP|nr:hypothetical protein CCACVL1_01503 [Corchorus capsularis]